MHASSYLSGALTPQQQQQLQAELTPHPLHAEPRFAVRTDKEAGDRAAGGVGRAGSLAGMRS